MNSSDSPFNSPRRGRVRAGDGAIVGWRLWNITRARPDVLVSPLRQTLWEGPVLVADTWSTLPAVEGRAGIHALHSQKQVHAVARFAPSAVTTVAIGRVRGYGKYIIGEIGWRAQRVMVDKLIIVPLPTINVDAMVAGLERRYHCPVLIYARNSVTMNGICIRCGHLKMLHRPNEPRGCAACGKRGPCKDDYDHLYAWLLFRGG